ncbi:unnamed protein product [Cuscuta campestris]|uniref:CRIB domain-containing protein n=1 Tax=Cuscuta campestris TaxID=132261 RepID=A0A484NHZ0_9ASTE|nr:unnamed protein product [Cuscuta campestris]
MTTKMKGLLKGLRYISQIFDEEKEAEIQIGLPTDVKHVAHIGWEGGQSVDNPSWMKEFKGAAGAQSAPLGPSAVPRESPEIKWVSQDSNRRSSRGEVNLDKDPDLPKSSRRQAPSSSSENPDSPSKSKARHSRRNRSKETAADAVKSDCPTGGDVPKKSRRKKSKDGIGDGGSTRSATRSSRRSAAQELAQPADVEASVRSICSDAAGDGSTRSSRRGEIE